MDGLEGILILLGLAILAVPVILIIVLVSQARLKRRVSELESEMQWVRQAALRPGPPPVAVANPVKPAPTAAPLDPVRPAASPVESPLPPPIPSTPPLSRVQAASAASTTRTTARAPGSIYPPVQPEPDWVNRAIAAVKRWFTEGNVPVKVGILVLFAGVAALLKYASDQGYLSLPIELRLAGIAAAALAALGFAWHKRESNRGFALSLQGGAIGVLLLTVFAAFKFHALMPVGAAFALSVILIAAAGVLAVVQNALWLALFALLAGFLAPIWLSTGSGNHVALFSYYAVLNAAIFAIAWKRSWRVLNLLGFAFTFGIGTLWGVNDYRPEKFNSTEPFLLLFFAFYLLIPLLHARQQAPERRDLFDGSLVFGTPLVVFSLQAALLRGEPMILAFNALALAGVYAGLAWTLLRNDKQRLLGQSFALLAVGFATLAVPLALSATATASVFALEGAALIWLGLRQQRQLPQWSGAVLQLAAAAAFSISLTQPGYLQAVVPRVLIANPYFVSAGLIALAGLVSAWSFSRHRNDLLAVMFYLWGLCWWLGNGLSEINAHAAASERSDFSLMLIAVTGWLAAEVHRLSPARALALTTLGGLAVAALLAPMQTVAHLHPFAGMGGIAWIVYAVLGARSLHCLAAHDQRIAAAAQVVWWLVWPLSLSLLLGWLSRRLGLQDGWHQAALILPWLLVCATSLFRWRWLALSLGAAFDPQRLLFEILIFVVLGTWWLWSLFQPGDSAPLAWIPILNPIELAQSAILVLLAAWLWSARASEWMVRIRAVKLAAAGFVLVTSVVLHAVHHWSGLGWDGGLVSSSVSQTSLTVVWSVLGVLGWVVGSRRGQRLLWLGGALLMAVVLVKLLLVDRGNLGNVLGIASFIAYGLLCTVVGYLAPAPPRNESAEVSA